MPTLSSTRWKDIPTIAQYSHCNNDVMHLLVDRLEVFPGASAQFMTRSFPLRWAETKRSVETQNDGNRGAHRIGWPDHPWHRPATHRRRCPILSVAERHQTATAPPSPRDWNRTSIASRPMRAAGTLGYRGSRFESRAGSSGNGILHADNV